MKAFVFLSLVWAATAFDCESYIQEKTAKTRCKLLSFVFLISYCLQRVCVNVKREM